jgi:hypothetical protein
MSFNRPIFAVFTFAIGVATAHGQFSAIPQLASRPNAAFTMYLNFGGFQYNGTWFGRSVGFTPAYSTDANANFSTAELANIRNIWSRTAEKYATLNINVTTIDPAAAAGLNASDTQRQNYYDSQAGMIHVLIGGDGAWTGANIGGISGLSVADRVVSGGLHTNFVFSAAAPSNMQFISEAAAHEAGHALRLEHQSLYNANGMMAQEYDPGTTARAPIMGNSYSTARGLWRVGTTPNGPTDIQNDLQLLRSNVGIEGDGAAGFVDSVIGHSIPTATALPLNGTQINFNLAKGIITPNSTSPISLGEENYTSDFFKVTATGLSELTVRVNSGRSTINLGTADPGATLDATLRILDGAGNVLGISNTGTFTESLTLTNLAAGDYFIQISSAGGDAAYFDVGSYFLTGQFIAVPEPVTILGFGAVVVVVVRWRKSRHHEATGDVNRRV